MGNVIDISNILRKASDRRDGFIFSEVVDGFLPSSGATCAPTIEVFLGGSHIGLSVYYGDICVCCSVNPVIAVALADALREGGICAS